MQTSGDPAVVIERAIAEHLEVLCDSSTRRILVVERIGHADALDRLLWHAVHFTRLGDARRLEDRRGNVDDVVELRAHSTAVSDALGPRHDQTVARAAKV